MPTARTSGYRHRQAGYTGLPEPSIWGQGAGMQSRLSVGRKLAGVHILAKSHGAWHFQEATEKDDAAAAETTKDDAKPETKADTPAVNITKDGQTYVLQSHVDQVAAQARADGKKSAKDEAKREADTAAAKERGDFEQLAKDAQERADKLEADLKARDLADLRRTVGAKHHLTAAQAERLRGETEAELNADAKEFAESIGARKAPDTEAGTGVTTSKTADRPIVSKPDADKPAPRGYDGSPRVAWRT